MRQRAEPTAVKCAALLLVRNGVEHDARVLRASRVARRTLGGEALVVGVATASCPAGGAIVDGIGVVRFAAKPPVLGPVRRPPSPVSLARVTVLTQGHGAGSNGNRGGERPVGAAPVSPPRLNAMGRARRILSGVSYGVHALLLARRVRPLVVQANDWNTMWCAMAIKLLCGSRLVYDSHELWADRNGRWEWRPWVVASEALFVRVADEVVTTSPGYADVLAERYRVRRPTIVRNIPEREHGSAPDSVDERSNGAVRGHRGVDDEDPSLPHRIVYIGGLMPGRGLEQTIEALVHAPEACLRAVGPGAEDYRMSLLARARSVGVESRVELRAPVAPDEVSQALAGATAGLCLIQPICRSYELCLPNKLFEYAAAGVPILASDLPEIAAVVREEGLGEVVPAGDPQAIADGFRRLCAPHTWNAAATHAQGFAVARTWAQEADCLADVYARLMTHAISHDIARRSDGYSDRTADSPVVHSTL